MSDDIRKIFINEIASIRAERSRPGTEKIASTEDSFADQKRRAMEQGKDAVCGFCLPGNTHNHTYFSVRDGASSPEAMVSMTAKRGFSGIGISDHGTMGGLYRAGQEGKKWKTGREKATARMFTYTSENLKKMLGAATNRLIPCDASWVALEGEALESAKARGDSKITFSGDDPLKFRILSDDEFEPVDSFKVLSGCELYVSWEKDRDKRYSHITVYATGQVGHRALTLLSSIGSRPDRRYIGEHGFWRPRVFVEDIATAIEVAGGELVVTTGCPGSITSQALREGRVEDARAFMRYFKERLPAENFFAELHLCDTSIDYNGLYEDAEGKYFSSLLGTPFSRFRYETESDAIGYSKDTLSFIRSYVLGDGMRAIQLKSSRPVEEQISTDEIDWASKDADYLREARATASAGELLPLIEAGITQSSRDFLSSKELSTVGANVEMALRRAEQLLAEKVGCEKAGDLEARRAWQKRNRRRKRKKGYVPVLDEDSLVLIDRALKVLAIRADDRKDRTAVWGLALFARFVIACIVKVSDQDISVLSPALVAETCLKRICQYGSASAKDKASLSTLVEAGFFLDKGGDFSARDVETIYGACRALVLGLTLDVQKSEELKGKSGSEDLNEKEWYRGSDGNWMEGVNASLLKLADEESVTLLLATDAHMAHSSEKISQDALIKGAKIRGWNFPRVYSVPRAEIVSLVDDLGYDASEACGLPPAGNAAFRMMERSGLKTSHLVEAYGATSLLMNKSKSMADFKWDMVVPRIDYSLHPYYDEARSILEDGSLREILPHEDLGDGYVFSDNSVNIETALLVMSFLKSVEKGTIPDDPSYFERFKSEIHLLQEAPPVRLADFFVTLQYLIHRFREGGLSVGPGRGSSGGMLTANVTGITYADPIKKNLLKGRFLTPPRKYSSPPDIDVDVENRQVAGLIAARVAQEAMRLSIKERPLDKLEQILHDGLYFSSPAVTHKDVNGQMVEVETSRLSALEEELKGNVVNSLGEDEDKQALSSDEIAMKENDDNIVWNTPIIRISTHGSLKSKAAVKWALKTMDKTPFERLPPAVVATKSWMESNRDLIEGLSESEINAAYEDVAFKDLSPVERRAKRVLKLADILTKEMTMGSGLARLYKSEHDFFMGSVYGEVPSYWDPTMAKPTGAKIAADYFDANPEVRALALDLIGRYQSRGVHAGGFCFGREVLERVPVIADKHGYVAQCEMKEVEKFGILKMDLLGLETLRLHAETKRLIVNELPHEKVSWLPEHVYNDVKAGGSTDQMMAYMPLSNPDSIRTLCERRAMIFQIDTPVMNRGLMKLETERLLEIAAASGDLESPSNDFLVDVCSSVLAFFRPGPMASNAHNQYLTRLMAGSYEADIPWVEPFVRETSGLIAYQEQVMAMTADGIGIPRDHPDVDDIRRAMGKKDEKVLTALRAKERFVEGLVRQGESQETAVAVWDMIAPFAEYGFNKSHSDHYSYLTNEALFLKSRYGRFFMRVMGAFSKPEDSARFVSEISEGGLLAPCVLNSERRLWSDNGTHFYPGLLSIEGLSEKNVGRLIEAKLRLEASGEEKTAFNFFKYFGNITPALAGVLSRAGALRVFGSPDQIAQEYERYVVEILLPGVVVEMPDVSLAIKVKEQENAAQDAAALAVLGHLEQVSKNKEGEEEGEEVSSTVSSSDTPEEATNPNISSGDTAILDDDDLGLLFDIRAMVKSEPQDAGATKTGKTYKMRSEHRETHQTLLDDGLRFHPMDARILEVKSAYNLLASNKVKGAGMSKLVSALQLAEFGRAKTEGRSPALFVSLSELDSLKKGGRELGVDRIYRTAAIVKAISMGKDSKTGGLEPRFSLISDGQVINVKLHKDLGTEKREEITALLQAVRMKTPIALDLEAKTFTPKDDTTRVVRYFRIVGVNKLD